MGKLIDKIERVQHSSGPRLGFAPPSASKQSTLVLVAAIPTANADLAAAAVDKGADSILVKDIPSSGQNLTQTLKVSSQLPVGAMRSHTEDAQAVGDFVVVVDDEPVAGLINSESIDLVLSLALDMPDADLRTIEALPVDAFLIPEQDPPLTVKQLIALYRVTRATSKPVLAFVSADADQETLRTLRDAGVAGLFVNLPNAAAALGLGQLRKAIDGLPLKRTRKSRRGVAAIGLSMETGTMASERSPALPDEDDDDEP